VTVALDRAPSARPEVSPSLDESAGALAVVRASARLLPSLPGVVVAYAVLAVVALASRDLAGLRSRSTPTPSPPRTARRAASPGGSNSVGVRPLLAVVAGLAILLGLVFLVVPGPCLVVARRLTVAAVMLEDAGALAALDRSLDLVSSQFWTVAGVVWLPVAFATGALGPSGDDLAALRHTTRVAGAATALVAQPVAVTANAVLVALYADAGPLGGDATPGGESRT
jgi:hypothetical protein